MEVSASIKSQRVSVFQPSKEVYEHWSEKRQCFVKVEHRGFVVDADNFSDAATNLISMVRPMHPTLGEQMIKTVNNIGVNAR